MFLEHSGRIAGAPSRALLAAQNSLICLQTEQQKLLASHNTHRTCSAFCSVAVIFRDLHLRTPPKLIVKSDTRSFDVIGQETTSDLGVLVGQNEQSCNILTVFWTLSGSLKVIITAFAEEARTQVVQVFSAVQQSKHCITAAPAQRYPPSHPCSDSIFPCAEPLPRQRAAFCFLSFRARPSFRLVLPSQQQQQQ